MNAAISFASVLFGVFKGTLDLSLVDTFYFGCAKWYLAHPDSSSSELPTELKWMGDVPTGEINSHQREIYRKVWDKIQNSKVVYLRDEGWDGNYWIKIGLLLRTGEAERVWMCGRWFTKENSKDEYWYK